MQYGQLFRKARARLTSSFINEILPFAGTKTFIAFSEVETDESIDKFLSE